VSVFLSHERNQLAPNILELRLLDCLRSYGFTHPNLTDEEMASELLLALFPLDEDEPDPPIWWHLIHEPGVCPNCMCTDCGCCVGCGGINADLEGGHGYACVM
jgi:hypothetical protein